MDGNCFVDVVHVYDHRSIKPLDLYGADGSTHNQLPVRYPENLG